MLYKFNEIVHNQNSFSCFEKQTSWRSLAGCDVVSDVGQLQKFFCFCEYYIVNKEALQFIFTEGFMSTTP